MGCVGSGKSSLFSALLAEMTREAGYVQVHNLSTGFGLAQQEAWIQHDTLRNNILFGNLYDETRYIAVVEACALQQDLKVSVPCSGTRHRYFFLENVRVSVSFKRTSMSRKCTIS